MKDLTKVLIRPVVTEKTTDLSTETKNKYVFQVATDANKHEIKQAVEKYLGVKVLDVRTMRMPSKPKRMGRHEGRRPAWKKAILTLAPEDKIEMFDVV